MTEQEWLAGDDPGRMWDYVRGWASDRKLVLFHCECYRRLSSCECTRRRLSVLPVGLRQQLGLASDLQVRVEEEQLAGMEQFADGLTGKGNPEVVDAAPRTLSDCPDCRPHYLARLHELFGNPFHPVAADPRWLTSTARDLARAIYAERAFDRLPILADALEDAGCDNADILAHCRGDGAHVRGCWVVDLILGKS